MKTTTEDRWGGGWRTRALEEYLSLREILDTHQEVVGSEFGHLSDLLEEARQRTGNPARRFRTWLRGGEIEHVWSLLDNVEQRLVRLLGRDERTWAVATAQEHLAALPARRSREEIKKTVSRHGDVGSVAAEVVRRAHQATAASEEALRDARNRLFAASATMVALVVALLVIQSQLDISVVGAPEGIEATPEWVLMLIVVGAGLVGGLLTAMPLLSRRTHNRYHLTPAKVALRGAMGMLTGFIGVLLLASGWIVAGSFTSVGTLILVALVFGAGQEKVTKLLDKQLTAMTKAGSGAILPAGPGNQTDDRAA